MISGCNANGRRCITDELSINFNVGALRGGSNIELPSRGDYRGGHTRRIRFATLELCLIKPRVTGYVSCNLGALGDGDVLPMHEEEKWCSREEHNCGSDHSARHCASMSSTLNVLAGG